MEVVKTAATELQLQNCEISKIDAYGKSAIAKYGLVITPAVAINGKIVVLGRIPSKDEIKQLLLNTGLKESEQR